MTAPIASGWSGCRVGLAPTGKRRLCTAHANNGSRAHSISSSRTVERGCDGHSGSPACRNASSYRARSSARQGPTTSLRVKIRSAGFSCRSRAIAFACSSRPAIALLAAATRNPYEGPDCPATPLHPMMPPRHSGPGGNVHVRSRLAFLPPMDQVGSDAWHARSARSPFPARRDGFLPSRPASGASPSAQANRPGFRPRPEPHRRGSRCQPTRRHAG
jgi:hypothetical protein